MSLLLFWFELCISGQTCPPNPNLPSISNAEMPQLRDRGHKICPPFLIQTLKPVQVLSGRVLMVANAKQSYDLTIECKIEVNQS